MFARTSTPWSLRCTASRAAADIRKNGSVRADPLPTIAVSVITEPMGSTSPQNAGSVTPDTGNNRSMVEMISVQGLTTLLNAGNFDVVDVRELDEWSAGHIPGARS